MSALVVYKQAGKVRWSGMTLTPLQSLVLIGFGAALAGLGCHSRSQPPVAAPSKAAAITPPSTAMVTPRPPAPESSPAPKAGAPPVTATNAPAPSAEPILKSFNTAGGKYHFT